MARLILIYIVVSVHIGVIFPQSEVTSNIEDTLEQNSIRKGSSKSKTLIDYHTRVVAYKDLTESKCLLGLIKGGESFIGQFSETSQPNNLKKNFLMGESQLSKRQIWTLGGQRVVDFCRGFPTYLIHELQPNDQQTNVLLDVPADDAMTRTKRSTKHFFVGRVRGQTQSQYLNFGNSKDPGKAEAESTYGSSKAVVSGSSGMGQAQSQSIPVGCEECYGEGYDQGQVLQYGGPGQPESPTAEYQRPRLPGERPSVSPGYPEAPSYPRGPEYPERPQIPSLPSVKPEIPSYSGEKPSNGIPSHLEQPSRIQKPSVPQRPEQPHLPTSRPTGPQGPEVPSYPSGPSYPVSPGHPKFPSQPTYPEPEETKRPRFPSPDQPSYPGPMHPYPSPEQPSFPGPAKPAHPIYPGPVAPTYPGPSQSTYLGPAQPSYPGPAQSTFPRPSQHTYPGPAQPTYPGPAQPTYPGPAQPSYTGPAQPTYPAPAQPTYPGPAQPTYPGPAQPTYPGPAQSTYPSPTQSSQIPPSYPESRTPSYPIPQAPTYPGLTYPGYPYYPTPVQPVYSRPSYPIHPLQPETPFRLQYPIHTSSSSPELTKPKQTGKFSGQLFGDYVEHAGQRGKFSGTFAGEYEAHQNGKVRGEYEGFPGVAKFPGTGAYLPSQRPEQIMYPGAGYPSVSGYPGVSAGSRPLSGPVADSQKIYPIGPDGKPDYPTKPQTSLYPGLSVSAQPSGPIGPPTPGRPSYPGAGSQQSYPEEPRLRYPGSVAGYPGSPTEVMTQSGMPSGVDQSGYSNGYPGVPGMSSGVSQPGYPSGYPGFPGMPSGVGQPSYPSGYPRVTSEVVGQPGTPSLVGQPGYPNLLTGYPGAPGFITGVGQPGYPGVSSETAIQPGMPAGISQPGYPSISAGTPGYPGVPPSAEQVIASGRPSTVPQSVQLGPIREKPGLGYPEIPGHPGFPVQSVAGRPGYPGQPTDIHGRPIEGTPFTGEGTDDAHSQVQTSVQQTDNATQASAAAQGRFAGGTAQSQVSGTYSGSGSFSASAGSDDGKRGALTQVSGGKEGAMSSAQGKGGLGQSQAQVQLASETGDTVSSAQTAGRNHGSQTQVQASGKGGMADAQANGPGSTSSQAQIGFMPYDENEQDNQTTPFRGGGMASAQSGTYSGQAQSQIQGKFHYGIRYAGAAQAGSGGKEAIALARNQSRPFGLSGNFPEFKPLNFTSGGSTNSNTQSQSLHNTNMKSSRKTVIRNPSISAQNMDDLTTNSIESEDTATEEYHDEDYDYESDYTTQSPQTKSIISQVSKNQRQHIILDPLEDLDATVQQSYGSFPSDGTILQPGELIPGSPGYQIPPGFRGRVKSITNGQNTYVTGKNSQAQSVTLTPGTGRIIYKRPIYAVSSNTHNKNGYIGFGSGYTYQPANYQLKSGKSLPNFISLTKSETGSKNPITGQKTPSVYYTQSSSCGVFTNTCVFNSSGKLCFPKPKTNPDGTFVSC